jgi:hypothetical protein
MAHPSDGRPPNRRQQYEHGGKLEEIRRLTVTLSLAGTSSGKPARSHAASLSERIALLTLGAAASDAMLWRAVALDHEENAETGKSQAMTNLPICAQRSGRRAVLRG